jgi:hypothetical protein
VELRLAATGSSRLLERREHDGHQFLRALAHDAAHVQRVADLAVERGPDGRAQARRVGTCGDEHPGSARAVQRHRRALAACDAAELIDGGSRTRGDRERQAVVGEQRPARGAIGRSDERDGTGGQARLASDGATACSISARAVPSASEPMRNTTAFPPRSTPHASATTLGRPSKTNATTPRRSRTCSSDQPSCS